MRAVDTNVLVRLLARDDPKQLAAAEAFVTEGAWVSHIVLVETAWVLESVYEVEHDAIADAIEALLDHAQLSIQDGESVASALAHYRARPTLGFSDCLILEVARRAGHLPLGTFDRAFRKLDGAHGL
jgi:predicted nucleic-acid-binding protein